MEWGMQNRMARIIQPKSGHALMLAVDHGYFLGPTSGLEIPAETIRPLVPYADALMLTRGILRTTVPPALTISTGTPAFSTAALVSRSSFSDWVALLTRSS